MKYFLPAIFLALSLGSLLAIQRTQSFLSDEEKATDNVLSVATEFLTTPSPTSSPSPTPTLTPITTHLVINEVYYDADAGHLIEGNENRSEWVEIYNPTFSPINVNNWQVFDNYLSETLPDLTIPAGGFLILAGATSSAELKSMWPTLPDTVLFVPASGNEIGNGLADAGDRLILKNGENTIDQMSYGNDTTFFVLTPVHEGHSWERSPAGKDTDTAGDFVDRTTPTPGS